MTLYTRNNTNDLLTAIESGETATIYLITGDRYLCRQITDDIVNRLLPDENQRRNNLRAIDGDRENPIATLSAIRTYNLFPGRFVVKVHDSRLFHSKVVAKSIWDKAKKAHDGNEEKKSALFLGQLAAIANISAEDLPELAAAKWKSLLGFSKPSEDLGWISQTLGDSLTPESASPSSGATGQDPADLFQKTFEDGIPANNILILVADAVDKRKRFYKYITQNGVAVDLAVDTGFSKTAGAEQEEVLKDLINRKLAEFSKSMEPKAVKTLIDRVGFHPVAVVMETEKLALYAGAQPKITFDDLDTIIGRTREEALFELTEAYTSQNLPEALQLGLRMREAGVHPLVLLAGIRNQIKKMLIVRALQDQDTPAYSRGMAFGAFQKGYLPRLKESREKLPDSLPGHPYALFMLFQRVENFSAPNLKKALSEVLIAEYRLKGSGLADSIILENLLFRIIKTAA